MRMKQMLLCVVIALAFLGCQTIGGKLDLDNAIAITELTLSVAEQGLEIYQIQLDREQARENSVAKLELQLRQERIKFLREQLTELMKIKAEKSK